MKKILCTAVVFALLFVLLVPGMALAAPDLTMQIEVSPTSLMTGGSVSLSVDVTNQGDEEAQNVTVIYDGTQLAELGNLSAGETKSYSNPSFNVPTDKLGKGMKFVVEYETNGETKSISHTVTVGKKEANVNVSTVVRVDTTTVAKGGHVNFTFAIENRGDVEITDARVQAAALNGGDPVCSAFSLSPGESKVVEYTATVMKDLKVEPYLTFKAAGESHKKNMDTKELTVSDAAMRVEASLSSNLVEEGQPATFTLNIANTGNIRLRNITVSDNNGNRVTLPKNALGEGESMQAQTSIVAAASGTVVFTVSADDESGETYTFQSNSLQLEVAPLATPTPSLEATATPNADQALVLNVEADPPRMTEPGAVLFTVTLQNNSDLTFTDVILTEQTLGEIEKIDGGFRPGEATFKTEVQVAETTRYVFSVSAKTPDGLNVSVRANTLTIEVAAEEAKENGGGSLSTLLIIVIILVVLIIGVGVTLIILIRKDKKQKQEEARHQQRAARVAMRTDSRVSQQPAQPRQRTAERRTAQPAHPAQPQRPAQTARPAQPARPAQTSGRVPYNEELDHETAYGPMDEAQLGAAPAEPTYSEPAYNEPTYSEPVFEEPVFEEPAAPQPAAAPEPEEVPAPKAVPVRRRKKVDFDDRNNFF